MTDSLKMLEDWAQPLIEQMTRANRRKMARDIATEMRSRNRERIKSQVTPDGAAFAPRKKTLRDKRGRIKKKAMFSRLRMAKWLKTRATDNVAAVEFATSVAGIARTHHYGLDDEVTRHGPRVRYAARPLLGITNEDTDAVRDIIMSHITTRL